jgi:hypothetical protein
LQQLLNARVQISLCISVDSRTRNEREKQMQTHAEGTPFNWADVIIIDTQPEKEKAARSSRIAKRDNAKSQWKVHDPPALRFRVFIATTIISSIRPAKGGEEIRAAADGRVYACGIITKYGKRVTWQEAIKEAAGQ